MLLIHDNTLNILNWEKNTCGDSTRNLKRSRHILCMLRSVVNFSSDTDAKVITPSCTGSFGPATSLKLVCFISCQMSMRKYILARSQSLQQFCVHFSHQEVASSFMENALLCIWFPSNTVAVLSSGRISTTTWVIRSQWRENESSSDMLQLCETTWHNSNNPLRIWTCCLCYLW